MSLDVYFQHDILNGLLSDMILVMDTARHYNALTQGYLNGVVSMAKAQAISYGIPWGVFVSRLREELSQDNLELLEAVL